MHGWSERRNIRIRTKLNLNANAERVWSEQIGPPALMFCPTHIGSVSAASEGRGAKQRATWPLVVGAASTGKIIMRPEHARERAEALFRR